MLLQSATMVLHAHQCSLAVQLGQAGLGHRQDPSLLMDREDHRFHQLHDLLLVPWGRAVPDPHVAQGLPKQGGGG